MKESGYILIGFIAAIILMACAFVGGYFFYGYKNDQAAPPSIAINQPPQAEPAPAIATLYPEGPRSHPTFAEIAAQNSEPQSSAPNSQTYIVSKPSPGDALELMSIAIENRDGALLALLPDTDVKNLRGGERVFLYDADNKPLDALGTIVDLSSYQNDTADGYKTVRISINETGAAVAAAPVTGKIIVQRYLRVQKLPRTALFQKNDYDTHAWEAVRNPDGTFTAHYAVVDVPMVAGQFFVASPDHNSQDLFILNPDSSLQEGQVIRAQEKPYSEQEQEQELRILVRIEAQERAAASLAGTTSGNSCGPALSTTEDFIRKIIDKANADVAAQSRP